MSKAERVKTDINDSLELSEKKIIKDELIESQRKLSTLMSNLPGMAYRCKNDEDWTMEFVSDGCKTLTGFEPSELLNNARISYAGLINPEDRYEVWLGVTEGLRKKEIFRLTYRIITKSGVEKWVYEQGQGIFKEGDEAVIEGFITDISERKRAEEDLVKSLNEKSILLSEIHHRVKNNMQLIISLLELQKMYMSSDLHLVLDDIIARIRIFADIHQDLYQSEQITEINIEDHLQAIFNNLNIVYSSSRKTIRLEMKIENPFFSLDTAIPLGLIMNELISNSLKHAFDDEEGLINITIECEIKNKITSIEYSDNGCRENTASEGFGMLLVNAMAAQLNLTMKTNPGDCFNYSFHA